MGHKTPKSMKTYMIEGGIKRSFTSQSQVTKMVLNTAEHYHAVKYFLQTLAR